MCKKLMSLLVVLAVLATTAPVVQAAELITAVAHRNTDSDAPEDPQIADSLQEGSLCYVDRTHIYVEIPESLIGAVLRTPQGCSPFLTRTVLSYSRTTLPVRASNAVK